MVYDIVFEPTKMLHEVSALVKPEEITTREMQKFIKDMIETMYVKDGVGLAAVQVGRPIQLFTLAKAFNQLNPNEDMCLFNPVWKKVNIHKEADEEGCLSVPRMYGKIKRYTKIKVKGLDKKGQPVEFVAEGFFARIIQHEVDHLNGHLYIENATGLHRVEKKQ
jgi:peptide deformylase